MELMFLAPSYFGADARLGSFNGGFNVLGVNEVRVEFGVFFNFGACGSKFGDGALLLFGGEF